MAIKAADGVSEGQIAVTEDELRELNNTVSINHYFSWRSISPPFLLPLIRKKSCVKRLR